MAEQTGHPGPSDERVEGILGNLLRIGVIISALVVFLGGVLYLMHDGGQDAPELGTFAPEQLRNPVHIARDAASLHALGLIMLGLLLLIATPVTRVIFSIAAFALQRDYLYVLFTLLVLAVLMYSMFSGYLTGIGAG
ncbi:MAG: DUF1634 domain-containing protein [Gemmataceae bacterium]